MSGRIEAAATMWIHARAESEEGTTIGDGLRWVPDDSPEAEHERMVQELHERSIREASNDPANILGWELSQ